MPKRLNNLFFLLILFIFVIPQNFCFSEEIVLTILHTNDTYGRLLPYSVEGVEFGGMLRRAYVIRQIISEIPNNVIVLDSGDAIGPYPLAAFDQGKTVIQMMNMMGYTAMALGNHEFDYGVDILRERIGEAKFAMLSANTIERETNKTLSQSYISKEVAGIKVGILGLTTPSAGFRAAPQLQRPIKFSEPFPVAKATISELKSQECDFIIALSHLGYQADMELSAQVPGINLIVGGEMRSYDEKLITAMSPVSYEAGPALVYCPWYGGYVGRVDVYLEKHNDGKYTVKDMKIKKYRLDEKSYPNDVISDSVKDLKIKLELAQIDYQGKYYGILGRVAEGEEINSLELVPLIVRKQTRAEVVLLNRGSLGSQVFNGEIKRVQVSESIQYENRVYTLEMSGAQIKDALAHSGKQFNENRRLIFSGIEGNGASINGRPITPNEYYLVATNDFLAYGGDGYGMIGEGRKKKNTGLMLEQVVVDYIKDAQESNQALSIKELKESIPKLFFKTRTDLGLLVEGLTVSETAKDYPKVNMLQSKNVGNFYYWSLNGKFSTLLAAPEYYLETNLLSKYGRLQHPDLLEKQEIDDNIQGNLIFKLLPGRFALDPLARFEVENIEFTKTDGSRTGKLVTQLSIGAERKIIPGLTISGGVLARRHKPKDVTETQLSIDLRAKYQLNYKKIPFQSELKFFPIFKDTASDEPLFTNYITSFVNSVKFPLNRYLFLSADAIIYRETQVGPWARKAQLALQATQTWGRKS